MMLRGTITPRFPWGIPSDALAPQVPFVLPPVPYNVPDAIGPVMSCWACLHLHLVALTALYLAVGPSRVTDRLTQQFEETRAILLPSLGPHVMSGLARDAATTAEAVIHDLGPQVSAAEAGWWGVVAQAGFALAAWYGLHPETLPESERAQAMNKSLRAGVEALFGEGGANRILNAATGDGAGDLLKLVAEVQLTLESSVHPDLVAHEPLA